MEAKGTAEIVMVEGDTAALDGVTVRPADRMICMLKGTSLPFDPADLAQHTDLDIREHAFFEVKPDNYEVYPLLAGYILKNLVNQSLASYRVDKRHIDEEEKCSSTELHAELGLGVGFFAFQYNGKELYAYIHRIGTNPVGTDCGPRIFQSMALFSSRGGDKQELLELVSNLIKQSEETHEDKVRVYNYEDKHNYWRFSRTIAARKVESVVMESGKKEKLMTSVQQFLCKDTKNWYLSNGIPYKKALLFCGKAGYGKSSLAQCLASKFGMNLCTLSFTPSITDPGLKKALSSAPGKSIIVLEDIDALFDEKRKPKMDKSQLTFSGLLNALDGVGSANGQIIILSTNHRERLDKALIRPGRVDLHVEFSKMTKAMTSQMFQNFYPGTTLGDEFADKVHASVSREGFEGQLSPAALQHFFVVNMTATDAEALGNVFQVVDEIKTREQEAEIKKKEKEEKPEKKKGDEDTDDDEKTKGEKEDESAPAPVAPAEAKPAQVDFHLHLHKE